MRRAILRALSVGDMTPMMPEVLYEMKEAEVRFGPTKLDGVD